MSLVTSDSYLWLWHKLDFLCFGLLWAFVLNDTILFLPSLRPFGCGIKTIIMIMEVNLTVPHAFSYHLFPKPLFVFKPFFTMLHEIEALVYLVVWIFKGITTLKIPSSSRFIKKKVKHIGKIRTGLPRSDKACWGSHFYCGSNQNVFSLPVEMKERLRLLPTTHKNIWSPCLKAFWITNQISVLTLTTTELIIQLFLIKLWPLLTEPLSQSRKRHLATINVRTKLVRPFWVTPRVWLNEVWQPRQRSWLKGQHYRIKFILPHLNHFSIGWNISKHPSIGPWGQTPLSNLMVWIRKWDTMHILQ